MSRPQWICRFWKWLHPHEPEVAALSAERERIVAEAKMNAAVVKLQTRALRRETGAVHQTLKAEMGPINQLLSQMDKRRND